MPIIRLPPHVIHSIAAGEVIDRPVSVVKELLENSIDAGATQIEIELINAGFDRIAIADNGSGIARDDMPLVIERYATSKLTQLEDLLHVETFGFRGEALFAIATVADVQIISCAQTEDEATELRTHRGVIEFFGPAGHRVGTTIHVDRLFRRFPVRRKALLPRKELLSIVHLVEQFALAHPHVGFSVHHDGKRIVTAFANDTFSNRLQKIWGIEMHRGIAVEYTAPLVTLTGWISTPEHFSNAHHHQVMCINGRIIYDSTIHKAIEKGFARFVHKGKQPQFFLHIRIPHHFVDINIHPQKKLVRFLQQKEIVQHITTAIQQTLANTQLDTLLYTGFQIFQDVPQTFSSHSATQPITITSPFLQLNQMYCIATTTTGYLIIDQHAADERLWYNKLLQDTAQREKIERHLSSECLQELEDDVYQHSFDEAIHARIATIACHQAIRAGQELSQEHMYSLATAIIDGGHDTLVCPHGRPTYIHVSLQQLHTLFRRK